MALCTGIVVPTPRKIPAQNLRNIPSTYGEISAFEYSLNPTAGPQKKNPIGYGKASAWFDYSCNQAALGAASVLWLEGVY